MKYEGKKIIPRETFAFFRLTFLLNIRNHFLVWNRGQVTSCVRASFSSSSSRGLVNCSQGEYLQRLRGEKLVYFVSFASFKKNI